MTLLIIAGAVLLRLVPHMPNFAPISAAAIFGGCYLEKRNTLMILFTAMIISDYLLLYINPFRSIGFSEVYPLSAMLHSATIYVYISFFISSLIGIWLRNHKKPEYIIGGSIFAAFQFFIITNFGVWAEGMYSRGFDGLLQSYIMGLPFFKWTLLSDLFYTSMFFSLYETAQRIGLKVAETK